MEKSPAAPCHGEQKGQSDLAQAAGAHPCIWFRCSGAFVPGTAAASHLARTFELVSTGETRDLAAQDITVGLHLAIRFPRPVLWTKPPTVEDLTAVAEAWHPDTLLTGAVSEGLPPAVRAHWPLPSRAAWLPQATLTSNFVLALVSLCKVRSSLVEMRAPRPAHRQHLELRYFHERLRPSHCQLGLR